MILWRITPELWRWRVYVMPAIFLWPMREQHEHETFWLFLCFAVGYLK